MNRWLPLVFCALLAACAGPQGLGGRDEALFDDRLFGPPSEQVGAGDVFKLSEAMRQYLRRPDVAEQLARQGTHRGLLEALYRHGELKLQYDAAVTRNAAQAFEARAGNCLSLVIMTAAFAKELGLPMRFQAAYAEETVSRSSGLMLRSGHVNISLGRHRADLRNRDHDALMVDFLPPEQLRGLQTREISEQTVLAMYMNNRAVETLLDGRIDDAYAWAREAVRGDPDFLPALNTLGVVYLRHGSLPQAAAAFSRVLDREPANRPALANLAGTYTRMGRLDEAQRLQIRLAQLEPEPPLHFFHLGLAAMKRHDFDTARALFAREIARADNYHELHYWMGLANYQLGDIAKARRHLARALQESTTPAERALYSSKLDWLMSAGRP